MPKKFYPPHGNVNVNGNGKFLALCYIFKQTLIVPTKMEVKYIRWVGRVILPMAPIALWLIWRH